MRSRFLRPGKNTIRIVFSSAEKAALAAAKKLPYPVPHNRFPVQSPHRNLIRKVQCHAGWDWGPCLMVAGIGGDISLGAFSDVRIDYVLTEQKHTRGKCVVRVSAECEVAREGQYELAVTLGERSASTHGAASPRAQAAPGLDIVVDAPKLWWPNGYGEQPLYDLTVKLGGHVVSKKIGLRSLELVNREDKTGLSMSFRVNGVDIFCKGANWIPCDALPQRQSRDRLEHLLSSAAWAQHEHAARLGRRPVRERRLLLPVRREGPPGLARHDVLLRAVPRHPGVPRQRGAGDPPPGEAAARPSLHRPVVRQQRGRGGAHLVPRVA